jgi:hypothetical protein
MTSPTDNSRVGPTPGPWGIEVTSDGSWIGPMRAAGDKVANIVVRVDTDREYKMEVLAEKKANARLIAAAPDLLEALEALERYLRQTPHHNAIEAAAARKVIAKARGEQA